MFVGLPQFPIAQELPAWQLAWQDEFDQPDGTGPDSRYWTYDVGGTGWGNAELQYYTRDRRENARIEGGHLIIEAHKETYQVGPRTWDYTSARLKTAGKLSWTYGRFEARLRVPEGQGLWSAFWMLGDDYLMVGWPECGEIDVMESLGSDPAVVHTTVHGPGYSGIDGKSAATTLSADSFSEDFHLFALEWEPGWIRFTIDGQLRFRVSEGLLQDGPWVFDHPFHLLLNIAVGGYWPGDPNRTTVFPQQMRVDYVRAYTRTVSAPPFLEIVPNGQGVEARWAAQFPHARLQHSSSSESQWTNVVLDGTLSEDNSTFVYELEPGFYRLAL